MPSREALAAIFGLAGPELTAAERDFFRVADPLGFILFARNCQAPDQIRRLVADLRDAVGRADAPVLIDQEGGRVARLRPPHWPAYPTAAAIGALPEESAVEAARLGARLIADDLAALGITVDCMPVLDIPAAGADPVIGDRAYGGTPARAAELGRAVCEGLLAGGVLPIVKHIPGHGRGTVDSHLALPVVSAPLGDLDAMDFAPFRLLADMPWAMTAHIVYEAVDPAQPATLSPDLIDGVIRATIGFDGVLLSDDLSMQALPGRLGERAARALAAGCDVVLHCNGTMSEMVEIAAACTPLTAAALRRVGTGEAMRRNMGRPFDRTAAEQRFGALLASSS